MENSLPFKAKAIAALLSVAPGLGHWTALRKLLDLRAFGFRPTPAAMASPNHSPRRESPRAVSPMLGKCRVCLSLVACLLTEEAVGDLRRTSVQMSLPVDYLLS